MQEVTSGEYAGSQAITSGRGVWAGVWDQNNTGPTVVGIALNLDTEHRNRFDPPSVLVDTLREITRWRIPGLGEGERMRWASNRKTGKGQGRGHPSGHNLFHASRVRRTRGKGNLWNLRRR